MSIDTLAPYPTLDVLVAVVSAFGVDPTWLMTGEYNSSTHRSAEAQPGRTPAAIRDILGALSASPHTPASSPLTLSNDA